MAETRAQILAAVRSFVADSFRDGRADGLTDDLGLVTSGIVDSAGVVQLVQFLERRFSVAIADEEVGLQHFNTLGSIADLVAAKIAAARRAAGELAGGTSPR